MEQVIDRKAVMKSKEADEIINECYQESRMVLGERVISFRKLIDIIQRIMNKNNNCD